MKQHEYEGRHESLRLLEHQASCSPSAAGGSFWRMILARSGQFYSIFSPCHTDELTQGSRATWCRSGIFALPQYCQVIFCAPCGWSLKSYLAMTKRWLHCFVMSQPCLGLNLWREEKSLHIIAIPPMSQRILAPRHCKNGKWFSFVPLGRDDHRKEISFVRSQPSNCPPRRGRD